MLFLSGRMRTQTAHSVQPRITLTIPRVMSADITLPFPTSLAWQWVEKEVDFILTDSTHLTVTLTANSSTPGAGGTVFFDDMCVSFAAQGEDNVPVIIICDTTLTV